MAIPLKQSTASQEIPLGHFVDETDGKTPETGLTIANTDIKLWLNGATSLANKNSGGATHMAGGVYSAVLDATDTATLGPLIIFVLVSGALPVRVECVVLTSANYDAAIAGTAAAAANVTQWNGTNVATPDTAGYPKVTLKGGTGTGEVSLAAGLVTLAGVTHTGAVIPTVTTVNGLAANVITATAIASNAITSAKIAPDAIGASQLAADAVDEILDELLLDSVPADGSLPTVRQAIYMIGQFLMERSVASTTLSVKKVNGSTTLMTFTLDSATAPTSITRAT